LLKVDSLRLANAELLKLLAVPFVQIACLRPSDCPEQAMFGAKLNVSTKAEMLEALRERDHADIALALAIACFIAECPRFKFQMGALPTTAEAEPSAAAV
jgi:hypothetical protein